MRNVAVGYEYLCRIMQMILIVHIAFIVHTLFGLILLGFFPSIAATYGTYRAWLLDIHDRSWSISQTWITFHNNWKKGFRHANLFGYPLCIIWALLIWEYWIVQNNDLSVVASIVGGNITGSLTSMIGIAVSGILLLINLIYVVFVVLAWAIDSHFKQSSLWILRYCLIMVIVRPLSTLMICVLCVIIAWLYWTLPGLAVALGLALPIFFFMMIIYSWGRLPGLDVHELEPQG